MMIFFWTAMIDFEHCKETWIFWSSYTFLSRSRQSTQSTFSLKENPSSCQLIISVSFLFLDCWIHTWYIVFNLSSICSVFILLFIVLIATSVFLQFVSLFCKGWGDIFCQAAVDEALFLADAEFCFLSSVRRASVCVYVSVCACVRTPNTTTFLHPNTSDKPAHAIRGACVGWSY